MGDIDFGLAMVAARIADSEKQKGRESVREGAGGPAKRGRTTGAASGTRTLSGATFDVVKGNLVLIPTGGPRETGTAARRLPGTERGRVVHIDRAEGPPARKRGAA